MVLRRPSTAPQALAKSMKDKTGKKGFSQSQTSIYSNFDVSSDYVRVPRPLIGPFSSESRVQEFVSAVRQEMASCGLVSPGVQIARLENRLHLMEAKLPEAQRRVLELERRLQIARKELHDERLANEALMQVKAELSKRLRSSESRVTQLLQVGSRVHCRS